MVLYNYSIYQAHARTGVRLKNVIQKGSIMLAFRGTIQGNTVIVEEEDIKNMKEKMSL